MTTKSHIVELAKSADRDLEALFDYVAATRSSDEAHTLLDQLAEHAGTLETFPERGPVSPELAAAGVLEFRQLLHGPYRLIYKLQKRRVIVVAIVDGRRNLLALLQRRLLGE